METQNINIASLLSKNTLSIKEKNIISNKLTNLLNIIETIHTNKKLENIEIADELLSDEIRTVAKTLVKKSDQFQKEIVESTLKKKEESMEMLEISKLRVQAQIKDIERKKTALTVKSNNTFFYNLKNSIFKLFNIKSTKKHSEKTLSLDQQLKNYNLKLSDYDIEKDKISKSFSETGSQKLTLLRRQTYYALVSSKTLATPETIQNIKEKIKKI